MSSGAPHDDLAGRFSPSSLPGLSRQSRAACSREGFEWLACRSRLGECVSAYPGIANVFAHHACMSLWPLDARDKPGHDVVVGGGHDAEDNGVSMMERRASAARGMVA